MPRPCTHTEIVAGCSLCRVYQTHDAYNRAWGGPGVPQAPGVVQQVVNFAGAVARHVAGGMQTVTEEEYQARLAVCQGCEHFKDNQCRQCGCRVAGDLMAKARWKEQRCPLGKWPPGLSRPLETA